MEFKFSIVGMMFFVSAAHAQITVQTQEYHEVDMPRLTVNPFPASHWDKKRANIRPRQRVIISVPVNKTIDTGIITAQDKEIITLIK